MKSTSLPFAFVSGEIAYCTALAFSPAQLAPVAVGVKTRHVPPGVEIDPAPVVGHGPLVPASPSSQLPASSGGGAASAQSSGATAAESPDAASPPLPSAPALAASPPASAADGAVAELLELQPAIE
jgi:hypothetical protein